MTTTTFARVGAVTLAVVIGVAAVGAAQPAPGAGASLDSRWTPWLGCWQLIDESVQDPQFLAEALSALGRSRANAGTLVCVTPANTGVAMTTVVNDRPVLTETIVANGSNQPLTEPDCRGWHRAEWSQDAPRLYAQAELACANQALRTVSGMSMMMTGPLWIDIQLIESEGRKTLRLRRYRKSSNLKHAGDLAWLERQAPRGTLPSRLTVADVQEANGKVARETLQAALVELKHGFDLNAKALIALDRMGVPDDVIDLMVALSYPERFVVERNTSASGSFGGGFDSMWPYYTDPFFFTSYYAPFGYRYWGHYDGYYFQGPGFVVVDPEPGIQPSGRGRVVDGHGYTRIRPNEPDSSGRPGGGGMGSSSVDRSGGAGSSGGVSSSGYSSGGSGGGGERTAQPRPPGI
jgi:hypothetical protein